MTPAAAAALAKTEQALAELRAAIAADGGTRIVDDPFVEDEWPVLPDDSDLVTTAIAAERAGRSPDTMRTWARERGIGKAYGGRIRISLRRLKKVLVDL